MEDSSSSSPLLPIDQLPAKPHFLRRRRRQGPKLVPLTAAVAAGLAVNFFIPRPSELTAQAWQLLSIFVSTVLCLALSPLPAGAAALLGLTAAVATNTLTFAAAFAAFTSDVIWLIVIAFFLAKGFTTTGLGERLATHIVKISSTGGALGLAYGMAVAEAVVAPVMPSIVARAAGVFLPVIKSVASAVDNRAGDGTARPLGAYLVQSQLQCSSSSAALFMTGAAINPLCLKLAEKLGVEIANPWVTWFKAASVPAFTSLLVIPFILYKIYPPETKDTPEAPALAAEELNQMGPVTINEWVMICTMLLMVSLWIFGEYLGIATVVSAMLGLSILLLTGVLDWDDCLTEKSAWDTLTWFAVVVGMASQLTDVGIVGWISNSVAFFLQSFSLSWQAAFAILQVCYFFLHYLFASQTGHIGALYSAFLAMNIASGVPGVLAALTLAYNSNLFAAISHYSSGTAAVYYGAGYMELPDVFRLGFIMALVSLTIWGVVGSIWWKLLGLY